MQEITTIGIDLAKSVFQVHAIGRAGPGRWSFGGSCGGRRCLRFSANSRLVSLAWRLVPGRITGPGN